MPTIRKPKPVYLFLLSLNSIPEGPSGSFSKKILRRHLRFQLSSRAADGYASDVPSGGLGSGGSFGYRYAGAARHRTMSPPPTSSVPASSTLLSNGFSSLTRPSTVSYSRTEPSMRFDTHTSTLPAATSRRVEVNGVHAAAPTFTRPVTVDGGTQTAAPNYKVRVYCDSGIVHGPGRAFIRLKFKIITL